MCTKRPIKDMIDRKVTANIAFHLGDQLGSNNEASFSSEIV
jgi:hypothetical protein